MSQNWTSGGFFKKFPHNIFLAGCVISATFCASALEKENRSVPQSESAAAASGPGNAFPGLFKPRKREGVNLLRNPSFEMGMKDWILFCPVLGASAEIADGGWDGCKCLRLSAARSQACDYTGPSWMGGSQTQIMTAPIWMSELPVKEGDTITISAYMRSDTPGTQGHFFSNGICGAVFNIDSEWRRHSVTAKIALKDYLKQYLCFSILIRGGGNLYIDAAQIEKGGTATSFQNSDTANIALSPDEIRPMLFTPGEKVNFTASAVGYKPSRLSYFLWDDYRRRSVLSGTLPVCHGGAGGSTVRINITAPECGYYELRVYDPDNLSRNDHLAIGCAEKLDDETLKSNSPVTIGNSSVDGDWPYYAAMLKAAGFENIRVYICGDDVWPSKERWDWPDGKMSMIRRSGIKPLVCIQRLPNWVRRENQEEKFYFDELGAQYAMPASCVKEWRTLVRETVRRYGDVTNQWECWNEPDLCNNKELARADEYVTYLRAMKEEISGLPSPGEVLAPCASDSPEAASYTRNTLGRGGAAFTDKISFHPYPKWGFEAPPDFDGYERGLASFTQLSDQYGKSLDVTELGWMAEQRKDLAQITYDDLIRYARMAPRAVCMLCAAKVKKIYFYSFAKTSAAGHNMDSMPLLERSWTFSPARAFVSLAAARRFISGFSSVRKLTLPDPLRCYIFTKKGKSLAVLWRTADTEDVLVSAQPEIRAYNLYGAKLRTKRTSAGEIMPCGEDALYIEWNGDPENFSVKQPLRFESPASAVPQGGTWEALVTGCLPGPAPEKGSVHPPEGWAVEKTVLNDGLRFAVTPPSGGKTGNFNIPFTVEWNGDELRLEKSLSVYSKDWDSLLKSGNSYTLGNFSKGNDGWDVEQQIITPKNRKKAVTESSVTADGGALRCKLKCGDGERYAFWARRRLKDVETDLAPFSRLEIEGVSNTLRPGESLSVIFCWQGGSASFTIDGFFSDNKQRSHVLDLRGAADLRKQKIERILIGKCGAGDLDFSINTIKLKL